MEKDTQTQLNEISQEVKNLTDEIYRNNFSSSQDFNKFSRFNTRLKVPHYDILPTVCEIGELCEKNGALYICSSNNTFTLV